MKANRLRAPRLTTQKYFLKTRSMVELGTSKARARDETLAFCGLSPIRDEVTASICHEARLRRPVFAKMAIVTHRRRSHARVALFGGLVLLLLLVGCKSRYEPVTNGRAAVGQPPTPAIPAAQPEPSGIANLSPEPSEKASPKPKTRSPAPRPHSPSARLTRHSGSLTGPIEYLVVEPANARPDTPLVIALHGRGDKAEKFASVAEDLALPVRTVVARGPVAWGRFNGRQWWEMRHPDAAKNARALSVAVDRLATLVDQLAKTYPAAGPPIIYGFSQGGMLALEALARRPGLFKAVAALSARLTSEQGFTRPTAAQRIPVLLTAGRKDRIIPPEQTQAAAKTLTKLGYPVEVVSFERAHTIDQKSLRAFLRKHVATPH